MPIPEYEKQKRFSEVAKRRQLIEQESVKLEDDLKVFAPALLAKAFRGEL